MISDKKAIIYAHIVSMAYVAHLIRINGDNIYKHKLGNLEVDSDCLAAFIEGCYEGELTEVERMCLYSDMLDHTKSKSGCKFKLGTTYYLNQFGIEKFDQLMSHYILMQIHPGSNHAPMHYQ